jgi:serine/threonine protein kinase
MMSVETTERAIPPTTGTMRSTGWPALDLEIALAGPEVAELARQVIEAIRRLNVPEEGLLPFLSMPQGDFEDRQRSRGWTIQFRALSGALQAQLLTLQDLLARVAFTVGEFQNAQRDFMALAKALAEPEGQALARFHAFRAALERPNYSDASVELRHAIALAPQRFSPVPLDRFDPEQIQAADCVGITLRCKTRGGLGQGDYVSLRTLDAHFLHRPVAEIFEDQKKLAAVKHRALLPVLGTGYTSSQLRQAFISSAYYEGTPLDQYVQRSGVIAPRDFVPLFLNWVEALSAAHGAGVWHRSLRPEFILIRRKVSGFSGVLTNFGLELRPEFYRTEIVNPTALAQTTYGRTLANAWDYAAPEQLGKYSAALSAATDVYSLAKAACLALFGTPHPALNHWRQAGEGLAQILHDCIHEDPSQRPNLEQIKARLQPLVDPELTEVKPGSIDPKFAALVASYQPPPGVGMTTVPVVPAGMPVRRRLSAKEVLWQWRFQMLKWGSAIVLLLMVAAVVIAIFWPTGAATARSEPVPVRGTLLLGLQGGDKPIANAHLIFIPDATDGKRATAVSDEKGEFTLQTEFPGDGALPGRYRVVVDKEPQYDRARVMPNVAETDRNFRDYLGGQLANLETEVNRNYSDERRTRLKALVPAGGITNMRIVLNVLGQ